MTISHDSNDSLTLRDTAKGIAVRAGILSIVALVVGTWLFSLIAKVASGFVKAVAGVLLLAIGGGLATWKVKELQRRLTRHEPAPAE